MKWVGFYLLLLVWVPCFLGCGSISETTQSASTVVMSVDTVLVVPPRITGTVPLADVPNSPTIIRGEGAVMGGRVQVTVDTERRTAQVNATPDPVVVVDIDTTVVTHTSTQITKEPSVFEKLGICWRS